MLPHRLQIAQSLSDSAGFAAGIRWYLLHPISLIIFALPPFLKVLQFMPLEFPQLGLWGDIIFYLLRIGAYLWLGWRYLPAMAAWLVARNIPFAIASFSLFFILLVSSYTLFHSAMPRGLGFAGEAMRLARNAAFGLFMHGLLMAVMREELLKRLTTAPALFPFFWPITLVQQQKALAAMVAPNLAGELRAIKAQNQYVEIFTPQGSHLLRMTLRTAIARLPAQSGMQIHRSWWLAETELAEAIFVEATGELVVDFARTYPVGASYAPKLRTRLNG